MKLKNKNIGFIFTGSFCMFKTTIEQLKNIKKEGANIIPIMSYNAYKLDTKFGKAKDFINEIETVTGHKVLSEIHEVEPIGPKMLLDIVIIAPCTGNTLSKLASGITDTSVTMAAKAHMRNGRPVLIAPSSNDALGASAKNIGVLLNSKNIFFVPFGQDDYIKKQNSLVADMKKIMPACSLALHMRQIQPVLLK